MTEFSNITRQRALDSSSEVYIEGVLLTVLKIRQAFEAGLNAATSSRAHAASHLILRSRQSVYLK